MTDTDPPKPETFKTVIDELLQLEPFETSPSDFERLLAAAAQDEEARAWDRTS